LGRKAQPRPHFGLVQAALSTVWRRSRTRERQRAHINYFAPHFPHIRFQPSDYDKGVFEAIRQMQAEYANANVWDPVHIDLARPETWPDAKTNRYDVIFAINLFHVAPIAIAESVAQIAARVLNQTGFLAIYGPFKVDGNYTAPSNEAFDRELRAANAPEWGLKDVRDVEKAATNMESS
jgi:hypothetical protein